jgi:hypothetical protein
MVVGLRTLVESFTDSVAALVYCYCVEADRTDGSTAQSIYSTRARLAGRCALASQSGKVDA